MVRGLRDRLLLLALIMMTKSTFSSMEAIAMSKKLKIETFLSPMFSLTPGEVMEKFYYNIDFPKGHIAMKAFYAEVVDEDDNSMPLYDTYLHHWNIVRYYQHKDIPDPDNKSPYCDKLREPGFIVAGSNGVCQTYILPQFYGVGSDARKTSTYIPDPYGIEVGNRNKIPPGYEEKWVLNVHVIDTRGVEDKRKCIECWCDFYNVTVDRYGKPLKSGYKGGMNCCYDKTRCKLSPNYLKDWERKNLFMKYTVMYFDWDDSILPVKVYILDVTDTSSLFNPLQEHNCLIEYSIDGCVPTNKIDDTCFATRRVKLVIPSGGYLVYGYGHQHIGGMGATLYGQDGRVLCNSLPIYGEGKEKGYIVGMTSCYPKLGSLKIKDGEVVTFESKYVPKETHLGVMGIFNIMVADKLPLDTLPSIIETVGEPVIF